MNNKERKFYDEHGCYIGDDYNDKSTYLIVIWVIIAAISSLIISFFLNLIPSSDNESQCTWGEEIGNYQTMKCEKPSQ